MPDKEVLLAEHNAYREEIRVQLARRQQSLYFVFAITLAVFGLDATVLGSTYWVFLVSAGIVAGVWMDETRRMKAVFRAATYIEVFIEPAFEEMNWETIGGNHPVQTSIIERAISNAAFPGLFVIHGAMAVVGALSALGMWAYLLVLPLLFVLVVILGAGYRIAKHGREEEKQWWIRHGVNAGILSAQS